MFNFEFKNNIQLLRAISVILVFLHHLNLDIFKKGYLGVDIFFVISGYVITQSIFLNYHNSKKVNILLFFKKRIFRIIPNLIFILSFVFVFYQFYGPNHFSLWNDFLSSLLGFSNLYYLFSNKGYFYNILDNPFAHSWSLGVEEQFYLLYPILIYFIFKNKNNFLKNIKTLKTLLVLTIVISLLFAIYFSILKPDLGFYFSPFRFWELGFGCILFIMNYKIPKNQIITNISFIILIILCLTNINIPYIFNNILAVILAGVYITTSSKKFFLNNKLFLLMGKISYSFYLWHLPIIFFLNLYFDNLFAQIFLSFIISFFLSILTYFYIEKPFIELNQSIKKTFLFISPVFILGFIFFIYIKVSDLEIKHKIREYIDNNNYLEKNYNWKKRVTFQSIFIKDNEIHSHCDSYDKLKNETNLNENCLKLHNNKYLVFIEGDSYTAQFVNLFNNNKDIKNLYFKFSPQNFISENLLDEISSEYENIFYVRSINNSDHLNSIINSNLSKIENLKFIFFNSAPIIHEKINVLRCLSRQTNCNFSKNIVYKNQKIEKLNLELKKLISTNKNVYLFDSYNLICPNKLCKIYDKNNDVLYYMDNTHLSIEGSQMLQKDINLFFQKKIDIAKLN
tara:strand:+ start:1875 stop:3740 length:1866 start_codon:yes stop_codon:yes gene_type:complete